MTHVLYIGAHSYARILDFVDVTSLDRPDPDWVYIDACGHVHMYHPPGVPYSPRQVFTVPTVMFVETGRVYDEDLEDEIIVGHTACVLCRQPVQPRRTADTQRVYIPSTLGFFMDGKRVSAETFWRTIAEDPGTPDAYRTIASLALKEALNVTPTT